MSNKTTFADYAARLHEFIETHSTGRASHLSKGPTDRESQFNGLALELFKIQFEANPVLRALCLKRGVAPAGITTWRDIPAVPTSAFKDLEVTSLAPSERTTVFHSSGTTEQKPSRQFHDAESLALYEASLLPWFRAHLLMNEEDRGRRNLAVYCLTPSPASAPHSSLVHMLATICRALAPLPSEFVGLADAEGGWTLDLDRLLSGLQKSIPLNQPVMLLGTAFTFVHLLDHLSGQDRRMELPPGSRVMETGGYKGRSRAIPKPDLHALLSRHLGVPPSHIVCEYGMSELSSQAYDGPVSDADDSSPNKVRTFRFPPWARVRIISPETGNEAGAGEPGLIRVLDLANVRSVLSVQTEDLGVRRGKGFELLGRAAAAEARGCSLMAIPHRTPRALRAALA